MAELEKEHGGSQGRSSEAALGHLSCDLEELTASVLLGAVNW